MTEKQEKIIFAAKKLFAEEGYNATSTSKVAKLAGVSEGLIFRHFTNKEGLLKAIIEEGAERAKELFIPIVMETDPKKVILKTIEIPVYVMESEHEYWRLHFKLKWEVKVDHSAQMEPLIMALTNAFTKLQYKQPEKEAQLLMIYIEGMAAAILKNQFIDKEGIIDLMKAKYNL